MFPPYNNNSLITQFYIMLGVITAVDSQTNTATVVTSHGTYERARIPIPYYQQGSGIFYTPTVGDIVIIGLTSETEAFILNTYTLESISELEEDKRVIPKPYTFVIKTLAGDEIQISQDHIAPYIKISGKKDIDILNNSGIINITNKNRKSGITVDTNDNTITFKVENGGGAGNCLVTKKDLEDFKNQIMNIIKTHIHPGVGTPPTLTISDINVTGTASLRVEEGEVFKNIIDNLPESLKNDPDIQTQLNAINQTQNNIQVIKNTIDTTKKNIDNLINTIQTNTEQIDQEKQKVIKSINDTIFFLGMSINSFDDINSLLLALQSSAISVPTSGMAGVVGAINNSLTLFKQTLSPFEEAITAATENLKSSTANLISKQTELDTYINTLKNQIEALNKLINDKFKELGA